LSELVHLFNTEAPRMLSEIHAADERQGPGTSCSCARDLDEQFQRPCRNQARERAGGSGT
jgi:hypothetical protein